MANVVGLNIGNQYGQYFTQIGSYHFSSTDQQSNTYLHLKTNISSQIYSMYMLEFVGYNYGLSQNVRSSIVFHTSGALYQVGAQNIYPGLTPQNVYYSSDNYVVIRCYAASFYYMGFVLNAYMTGPYTGNPPFNVTAVQLNTNSGTGSF